MLPNELAQSMYKAYGETTEFKNYQGLPMPAWNDLTDKIRSAWEAAAKRAIGIHFIEASHEADQQRIMFEVGFQLDERERAQVDHALEYAEKHSKAGVNGHSAFMLIAKLAKALEL